MLETVMSNGGQQIRRQDGNAIVELPLALWMLFFCILFPLIALSTMGLRYTFVVLAAHDAAKAASRAPLFATDIPGSAGTSTQLSAVNAAQAAATKVCNSFAGVSIEPPVDVTILEFAPPEFAGPNVPLGPPTIISHPKNAPLGATYDPGHIYKIKVDVKATLDPLVTIPGVVGPYTTTVSAQQVAENLQGLNQ